MSLDSKETTSGLDQIVLSKFDKIIREVNDSLEKSVKITFESKLQEELGLDSLDLCHFLYEVEKEFNISINEGRIKGFSKVGDYYSHIKQEYPDCLKNLKLY